MLAYHLLLKVTHNSYMNFGTLDKEHPSYNKSN